MTNHLVKINKHSHFYVQAFHAIIESNNHLKEDK
jgi:hypothetical protein